MDAVRELVIGNRILAYEGVVDAFGHISVRHPDDPEKYLLSASCAPELITPDDIVEFWLDGEQFIHGSIFNVPMSIRSFTTIRTKSSHWA